MLVDNPEDFQRWMTECAPKMVEHDAWCPGCACRLGLSYGGTVISFLNVTSSCQCPVCKNEGRDEILKLTARIDN